MCQIKTNPIKHSNSLLKMFKYGNLKIYTFAWVKFDFIEFIGIKLMCGKEDLKQW